VTGLSTLHVTGSSAINTDTVTTGGTQAYDGQATLGASTTLTGSTVTFLDKVVGAGNGLTVSGDAVFGNAAADTVTGLSTLHVTGSSAINTDTVTTGGTQAYDGQATLGADTTLTGVNVGFGSAVNSDGSNRSLTVTASGATTFSGAVGDSSALSSLTVNGGTTTTIDGAVFTSAAAGVTLDGTDLAVNAPITTTGGGGVTISQSGTVVTAAAGDIVASGAVSITSGGPLSTAGDVSGTAVSLTGFGLTNSGTIAGSTSVTVNAGDGTLDNSAGTITNGGGSAPIILMGDSMSLSGGFVTGGSGAITLTSGTPGQAISLISGSGLLLVQADLDVLTTTGGLTIGDSGHIGDITVGGTVTTPGVTGGFTINNGYDGVAGGPGGRILDSGAGLIDVADAVTLKAFGDIGATGPAPVHVGAATSLSTLSESGNVYVAKNGPLVLAEVGVDNPAGAAFFTATGSITQSAPIAVNSFHAAVTGSGGITLQNPLNTVDFLYLKAPGALAYRQDATYTVVSAIGGGMSFSTAANLNLAAVIAGGPLNIDAGAGDVVLTTTGVITISGPGKVHGRNLYFNFANAVNFVGGSNVVNPNVSNNLSIKASGDVTINASSMSISGGTTIAGAGKNLTNDAVIQAAGSLSIDTTGDFILSGGTATANDATAVAQANAFLSAKKLDLNVGGNFIIKGGTANLAGGEANASAIVLINSGKAVEVDGHFLLTGGTITGSGKRATALAVFDPDVPLNIKTGGSVAVVAGTAPSASANLLASAGILNAGPIDFNIGGSGDFIHPDPVVAAIAWRGHKVRVDHCRQQGIGTVRRIQQSGDQRKLHQLPDQLQVYPWRAVDRDYRFFRKCRCIRAVARPAGRG
jgi:hypothetical protein